MPQEEVSDGCAAAREGTAPGEAVGIFISCTLALIHFLGSRSSRYLGQKVEKAIARLKPKPSSRPFLCITGCSLSRETFLSHFVLKVTTARMGIGMTGEANHGNQNYRSADPNLHFQNPKSSTNWDFCNWFGSKIWPHLYSFEGKILPGLTWGYLLSLND